MILENNPELRLAFDFVQYTNRNIFLTGKAGTGKTTFLHNLRKISPKRMVITAPTGVAAINAGGVTLHSFFLLPFHPHIPLQYLPALGVNSEPSAYKMSREKISIIKSLDLLVIDEISMVRADLLDAVDHILRRYKDRSKAFGGVQLLMIGDIQQLAPIAKEADREILEKYYDTFYFFGSHALQSTDYLTIELRHIYRQQDQKFIDILNKVRDNRLDAPALAELNKRYNPTVTEGNDGYITLTTHNAQAQSINSRKLQHLDGKLHTFRATIKDDFPEYSYPTDPELMLKEGAQVMFIKNDVSREKLYFNGKIGKIIAIDEEHIEVKCPEDQDSITVGLAEWQNMKYSLDEDTKEINETVIGSFLQYPLKLAWAITIHKSQGLTFDKAIIDARSAFTHGQVYVALSRCRSLEGLILSMPVAQHGIITDPVVSGFVKRSGERQPGEKEFNESRKKYQQELIRELFDFEAVTRYLNILRRTINENKEHLAGNPLIKLDEIILGYENEIYQVSFRFHNQINRLLAECIDIETDEALQERIRKACEYFSEKLICHLEALQDLFFDTDNKSIKSSISDLINKVNTEYQTKHHCLNGMKPGFRIKEYLDIRAKTALETIPQKKKSEHEKVNNLSGILYPSFFNELKEWRAAKAEELDLPHYMILPQATLVLICNELPQNIAEVGKIKGMGKTKTRKFGNEIVSIVASFCSGNNIVREVKETSVEPQAKVHTREITFSLYKQGKSIPEIAQERKLAPSTIESHLAWYIAKGELDVTELVSSDMVTLISGYFGDTGDYKMAPVKALLGDQVSWSEIRYVAKHLEFLKKGNQNQGSVS